MLHHHVSTVGQNVDQLRVEHRKMNTAPDECEFCLRRSAAHRRRYAALLWKCVETQQFGTDHRLWGQEVGRRNKIKHQVEESENKIVIKAVAFRRILKGAQSIFHFLMQRRT